MRTREEVENDEHLHGSLTLRASQGEKIIIELLLDIRELLLAHKGTDVK
jgi:hypothetical protein